jgi:hypothetical protein
VEYPFFLSPICNWVKEYLSQSETGNSPLIKKLFLVRFEVLESVEVYSQRTREDRNNGIVEVLKVVVEVVVVEVVVVEVAASKTSSISISSSEKFDKIVMVRALELSAKGLIDESEERVVAEVASQKSSMLASPLEKFDMKEVVRGLEVPVRGLFNDSKGEVIALQTYSMSTSLA